jgi:hypothetical protein
MIVAIHDGQSGAFADLRHGRPTPPHAVQVNAAAVKWMRRVELWLRLGSAIQVEEIIARDVAGDEVERAVAIPVDRVRRKVAASWRFDC